MARPQGFAQPLVPQAPQLTPVLTTLPQATQRDSSLTARRRHKEIAAGFARARDARTLNVMSCMRATHNSHNFLHPSLFKWLKTNEIPAHVTGYRVIYI